MIALTGKGAFLWVINRVDGNNPHANPAGDPVAVAQYAKAAGITHAIMKIAGGSYPYNSFRIDNDVAIWNARSGGLDLVGPQAAAFRAVGIQPWGFHYIYGVSEINARHEALFAIEQVDRFGLAGLVVNAENEFKAEGAQAWALAYMSVIDQGLRQRGVPVAFSSYKYPSYHRPLPFEIFLQYSDVNMPQVYWVQQNSLSAPGVNLARSLREYREIYKAIGRPEIQTVPTGAAYGEHGWVASADQVTAFLQAVKDEGLQAANFWEWRDMRSVRGGDMWAAMSEFDLVDRPTKPKTVRSLSRRALNHLLSRGPAAWPI